MNIKNDEHLKVQVKIEVEEGNLKSVSLSPSEEFGWEIFGNVGATLKNRIETWLKNYKAKRNFELPPIELDHLSPFTREVLSVVKRIPFGHVLTYKEVAEEVGSPSAYRAVGTACGRNPYPLLIPCHRVIGSDGKIGGFTPSLSIKEALLEFEQCGVFAH